MRHREQSNIILPQLVTRIRQRPHAGRPTLNINEDYLREAMSTRRNISQTELAQHLGIHRNTLRRKMKQYGITRSYSKLSNSQLDALVRSFKRSRPQSGFRYVRGFLVRNGVYIQRRRVLLSLRRVDGIGAFIFV